jgi:hypothetical protein
MADGESEFTVNIQTNLDEINRKVDELFAKFANPIEIEFTSNYQNDRPPPSFSGAPQRQSQQSQPTVSGGPNVPGSTAYNNLNARYMQESVKHFKVFTDYMKDFRIFSSEMSQVTRGIMGMGTGLLRLGAGGGGLALGGAAAAFAGMTALAKEVTEQRRQALQLGGGNLGKMRAAGTAFGNIINVPESLGKISEGQFGVNSAAFKALTLLGFSQAEIQGSDPAGLLAKALPRERARVQSYNFKGATMPAEEAMGAAELFGPGAIKALGALPEGELQDRTRQYQQLQKTLDLTEKEQQAMDRFTRSLDGASDQIENVMTKNLAKMAPYFTTFTDTVADFIVNKIPHEQGKTAEGFGTNLLKDFLIPFEMNEKINKWFDSLFNIKGAPTGNLPKVPKIKPEVHSELEKPAIVGGDAARALLGKQYASGGEAFDFNFDSGEKLSDDVKDTTKSFNAFNRQLMQSANIFVDLNKSSGQYLADREKAQNLITGAPSGPGSFLGGQIGTGTTLPDVSPVASGGYTGTGGAPEGVVGRGVGGAAARPAKGALKANQNEAYKAFKDLGYSDQAARIAVANMSGESLANPADVHADPSRRNPNQKAHGIASWDDARSERIKKQFGKYPNEMSVADQTKAYDWEQKKFFPAVWKTMHDPNATPEDMMRAQVDFESPADKQGAIRSRLGFYKGFHPGEGGAPTVPDVKTSGTTSSDGAFFSSRNKQNLDFADLNSEFAGNLKKATEDAEKATGQKAEFTSLARTREEQERLYYNFTHHIGGQGLAARPGTSLHEKGLAADLGSGAVRDWVRAHASNYGMELVPGDPEHVQMARALRDKASNDRIADAIKRSMPKEDSKSAAAVDPYGRTPPSSGKPATHIGDMSMFQHNDGMKIRIDNPAGSNVNIQTAMLGLSAGSFTS